MMTDIDIMRGHFIGHSCFVDRIHSDLLGSDGGNAHAPKDVPGDLSQAISEEV